MTQVDGFVADPWRGAGEARAGWCFGFVALAHGGDNRYRVRVGLGQGRTFISQRWEREFDAVNEALAAFGFRFDASAPRA